MPHYLVTWCIDAEEETPLEAALNAFKHMQRPGTTANVFDVIDTDTGEVVTVDLEEYFNEPQPELEL